MYKHWSAFKWMWSAAKGFRGAICAYALAGLLKICLGWIFIALSKMAVDVASGERAGSLFQLLWLLPLVIAIELGVNAVVSRQAEMRGVKIDNKLKKELFRHLLDSEWRGIEKYHTGDIVNRLQGDVAAVVAFINGMLPNMLVLMIEFVGSFVILWYLDPVLACIILCVCPAFVIVGKSYAGKLHAITRRVRESDGEIQSQIQESLQYRHVVKTLEQTDGTLGRLSDTMAKLNGYIRRRSGLSVGTHTLISAGFSAGYVLTFAWGVVQIGQKVIGYGTMTAFLQLSARIQRPIVELSRLLPGMVRAFTAAERLGELRALPLEPAGVYPPLQGAVGLKMSAVDFCYPGSCRRYVLKNFDYDFRPGTSTAILGETGAGKTTLIRLLLALAHPESGDISLYSVSGSRPVDAASRCYFTYVPQGNTLFSGTIRSNLQLAAAGATEKEMWQALQWAAADFVGRLPLGLDTPCGERGGGLSEGQAQRVVIARALLRPAPVLLLDEATSALDPATEQTVIDNILSEVKDKTVIMVTHRPAAAARCQAVLRMGSQAGDCIL